MAVEVFSSVTGRIDDKFLSYVVSTAGRDHSVIKQLLGGMSSNLHCWQKDDGSWHMSGCLNNVVEAGANLLALYTKSQAAARSSKSAAGECVSGHTSPPIVPKSEHLDDGDEGDLPLQDSIRKDAADLLQSETAAAIEAGRKTRSSVAVPNTRQLRSAAVRKMSSKAYGCPVSTCKKSFSSSTNLRRHVRANHETGRFQCQSCPVAFKRCDSLLRHRRTAHADLQCTSCRKVFKNMESKSAHVCHGRSSKKLSCTVCSKSFISRSNLNKHIRMTHGAIVFPCKECGKVYRHSDALTLHTWKNHQRFICPQCGSVHETANLLCKHMSSVHGKTVRGMSAMKLRPGTENGDDSLNMNNASDGDDGDANDNDTDDFVPDEVDGGDESLVQAAENGEVSFIDAVSDAGTLLRGTPRKNKIKEEPGTRSNSKQAAGGSTGNSCHFCNKSFSSESNLRRHIRVNHEASQFPCHMCKAVFKRIDSLVRHKRANHLDLCCKACRGVFNSAEAKSTHECMRPSEKKLSCDVCGKTFVNRSNLNKHSYLVHGGVKFYCTMCPKFFRRSMTLTLHMWKFHSRFDCPRCSLVLDSAALLCEHMSSVHGQKATKNLSEICRRPVPRSIPVANCTRCNKMFSSRSNLAKHIRVVHSHPRWHCSMCERTFTSELQLSLHIRTFHQHLPMKCSKCPAEFTRQKSFLLHQRNVHHCDRNFQCETCGRSFLFETNFIRHQQQHQCSAVHLCEQCGSEFSSNYRLIRHVRVEHEGLRYICSVCGAQFRSDGKRREHEIARHTALKPRQCRHCGAAFARYSSLSRHLRQCRGAGGKPAPLPQPEMPPREPPAMVFPASEASTIDNLALLVPVPDMGVTHYLPRQYVRQ